MQDENQLENEDEIQDGKQGAPDPHQEHRSLNRVRLTFVSVAVLLCLALIGGSAWSLVSGGGLSVGVGAQGEGSSVQANDSFTANEEPKPDEVDASDASNAGSGASGPTDAQDSASPEPRTVTVTISADGTVGGGGKVGPMTLTFDEGATVYDALANTGWSPLAEWGAYGAYVTSINGVAAGPKTGWTYTVNGSMSNYACSDYTLADGDAIQWTFIEVK